jgi:hypothetical protein
LNFSTAWRRPRLPSSIRSRQAAVREVLGDGDDETEIGADELLAGLQGVLPLLLLRGVDLPHPPREGHLLLGGEQRDSLDLLEVLFYSGLLSDQACQCHVASHYTAGAG